MSTWIIDPGIDIPESASKIHGITTQQAKEEGARPTEALEEIATLIVEAQLEGVPLVAFNASFDLTILNLELARHGLATLEERMGRQVGPVIDPLVLDRALNRFRKGSRKLGDLVTTYGVDEQTDLHTADVDVEATLDVLAAILENDPNLAKRDHARRASTGVSARSVR